MNIFIVLAFIVGLGVSFVALQFTSDETRIPAREQSDTADAEPTATSDPEPVATENRPEEAAARLVGSTLDLSHKGLTAVDMSIFDQRELVALDLSHNKLTGSLPAEVRHLQNLKRLDLSDNNFTGVPAEVGQLSTLEVLDLSNNTLTGLPYELGNLSRLQTLDLRGTNYAVQDLEVIKRTLPAGVNVLVD